MAGDPFLFIAGPCVIESESLTLEIAQRLKDMTAKLPVRFVFKASYDKANRTSLDAYRGPGLDEGLRILSEVKRRIGVPVLSDVHETAQVAAAAQVLDVIQIPAFLMRQTDLVVATARTGRIVNLKKAQFAAPEDMRYAIDKIAAQGNAQIWLTERGTTFGYHNLVADMRSIPILRRFWCPVIFDATHSVQLPGNRRRHAGHWSRAGPDQQPRPGPSSSACDAPG